MQAKQLIETMAIESKKDQQLIQELEVEKEDILMKVDTDVKRMSAFLDERRERKIKLQNQIHKIFDQMDSKSSAKDEKRKAIATL